MGISGLLPFLKKSSRNAHVREFKGKTVVIDAYCWLHKGAFSCADKLVKGEKTEAYVTYCMKLVNMLLSHDIKPILVFDGQPLPSKLGTELKRRENRERYKMQARDFLRQGNSAKARECFQKCVDVTSGMALDLIKVCRARNIDCVVAPYEADAQLAYFSLKRIADVVITEDSDLLAFGCHRVLFKMDMNGNGVLIERDQLYLSLGGRPDLFDDEKFRRMCILAGCDYLPSLPGIGVGKSFKFFSRTSSGDLNSVLCRIPGCLNMPQLEVTSEYRDSFIKAELTFLHQLVYDPIQRKLVPLNSYPAELDASSLPFAGEYLKDDIAFELALGNLNVETLATMDSYNPDTAVLKRNNSSIVTKHPSIWSRSVLPYTVATQNSDSNCASNQDSVTVKSSPTEQTDSVNNLANNDLVNRCKSGDSSKSPVLSARKRKRIDENSTPTSNKSRWSLESGKRLIEEYAQTQSVQSADCKKDDVSDDVFSDSCGTEKQSVINSSTNNKKTTDSFFKRKSPFAKLKPQTNEEDKRSVMQSPVEDFTLRSKRGFSQLRTVNNEGQETITSTYFQTENIDVTTQLKKVILGSDDCSNVPSTEEACTKSALFESKQFPPSNQLPKTPANRLRVGLSRTTPKDFSKTGMKQLNLREMFAAKQ